MNRLFYYFFKRLAAVLPLLVVLPFITFCLMHLMPGNYFDSLRLNPQISPDTIKKYEALYHLDKPLLIQYLHWLKNLAHLDFGYSFAYKQPVFKILGSRLWNTFLLSGVSFVMAWLLAVVLGLWAGMRRDSWLDRVLHFLAYAGLSMPAFLLSILLLALAAHWGGLPLGGMKSVGYEEMSWPLKCFDVGRHMVIPVTVIALNSWGYLFRVMRAQVAEIVESEFVLLLRSYQVSPFKIAFKHVARNALNPMISIFGLELPSLFSGVALVEIITGWPGLGQIMLQAVRTQDVFLVLGNMVMISVLLVAGNLIADILLAAADPRIRMEKS